MVVDVSGVTYFAPILAYLLVAIVVAAVLIKTELLGKSKWLGIFVALFIATLFVSVGGVREYVEAIVPWFGVLVVVLFFLLFLIAFVGKDVGFLNKWAGVGIVIVGIVFFIGIGMKVFSDVVSNPLDVFGGWVMAPRVFGGILLLIVSALAAWILVKTG